MTLVYFVNILFVSITFGSIAFLSMFRDVVINNSYIQSSILV